jgi:hypothetical protein
MATRRNLKLFLITSVCNIVAGCASSQPAHITTFDAEWSIEPGDQGHPPKACLYEQDVQKLKETLDRCQAGSK